MYVVFLAGGIASGKSTVARELERRGAVRVDLDQLSRQATAPGSATNARLAQAFGADVVDARTGALRRQELARRAFASAERTRELEGIVHPAIRELLSRALEQGGADEVCVVEVPLLDRVADLVALADEVVCVTCPQDVRRRRAIARGMDGADFDARAAQQVGEAYLRAHATTVFDNNGSSDELLAQVDAWWRAHARRAEGVMV